MMKAGKKLLALMICLMLWGSVLPAYAGESVLDMFTNRDGDASYDASSAVHIELNGDTATASSDSVRISGSTIILSEEATYIISGTLEDGMIVINAGDKDKLQLVLNGASITSATSAPLYIIEADKVFVTLIEGTESFLINGGSFVAIDDNNIDAAVFSKQDLTFNGAGKLTVTSPAGHGIVSKDDLVFSGGTYEVTSASHAIDANDSVRIRDAAITAVAGKDGIHSENSDDPEKGFVYIESGSLNIEAEGDGVSAGAYTQIKGGTLDILAGGGSVNGEQKSSFGWGGFGGRGMPGGWSDSRSGNTESEDESSTSMKGLKSEGEMMIVSGTFRINSADDAIHSNTSISISGGAFDIASGDDAIHAEETLTVSDGTIRISESYEGLEALHVAVHGGDIQLVATDDGLNAAGGTDSSGMTGGRDGMFGDGRHGGWGSGNSDGSIVISGGTLYINSSGDGLDANGTIEITDGYVTVTGPTQGDTTVLDYDLTGVISGGTFIGTGSSMMAQSISGSGQGVIAVSVGQQAAGTAITILDGQGNEVLSHEPELPFEIFIFSSPLLRSGEVYTLNIGSLSGEVEAN